MSKSCGLIFAFLFLLSLNAPARAAHMTASCARLLGVSDGEASYIYFRAEEDLGKATAARLWSVYHRLRNHCADQPHSSVDVVVDPQVKAFLEAYR